MRLHSLHRSEWLHLAQAIPVGQSRRCRHGNEPTDAMVVYNNDTYWSARCHRCGVGARVNKEHVLLRSDGDQRLRQTLPNDLVPLAECNEAIQQAVWRYMVSKGIDPNMLRTQSLYWAGASSRVVFKNAGEGAIGRYIGSADVPKWVSYWVQGKAAKYFSSAKLGDKVVITEDYLSAIKVTAATQGEFVGVAALGTRISQELLLACFGRQVTLMLDGDSAGQAAVPKALREFRGVGVPAKAVRLPVNKDPKDLTLIELKELLHD